MLPADLQAAEQQTLEAIAAGLSQVRVLRDWAEADTRALAELVARDGVDLAPGADPEAAQDALVALKGIGPWTAMYVRMRAIRDLDAFPAADLGVLVALADAQGRRPTAAEARRRGEAWRPYRGVATMHLWGLA